MKTSGHRIQPRMVVISLFFLKAAERVDFPGTSFVNWLIVFRLRVELRQVGPRDEAKIIGGYGRCGRILCCANFLGSSPRYL